MDGVASPPVGDDRGGDRPSSRSRQHHLESIGGASAVIVDTIINPPPYVSGHRSNTRMRWRIVSRMRGCRLTSALKSSRNLSIELPGPQHAFDMQVVL
jgi:hypothetical protein